VADTSALGGADRVPSVREARQIRLCQRAPPDWSGRHGSRFSGPGLVSRETNGEGSAGSAPQVSADGTEH